MSKLQLLSYKDQYKEILKLAAPVMLSQLGVIAVQLFDNAMVGRLGALPLAAVSFGGTVFFMVFIFITGLAMALTPLVGEQFAQGKQNLIISYFQNSFILYFIAGCIATLVLYLLIPAMFYMGQPHEVVEMSIPYYKYLVWSVIPYMIFCSFKQFLEGIGNTSINMIIIVTANLINIFFNWLFIYGNWGFPRMEAAGAGLATFISRVCMPVFALLVFIFIPKFRFYLKCFRRKNFSWIRIKNLLSVGLPISSQMFMEGAAFALTSIMMGWIGTIEIAANQIALTISNVAFMIVVGLSSATTIRISHEYGKKNMVELKKAANASYHLSLAWNTFTALMFILFREQIVQVFTNDPEVIKTASYLLFFVAAFQFSDGLQSMSVGILRGIQDVKQIMKIAFISYIAINLPVGYLCAFVLNIGPGGLWIGFIFGLSIAAILLMARFRKRWKFLYEEQMRAG
jgi:MATE family multidrug resistance protein